MPAKSKAKAAQETSQQDSQERIVRMTIIDRSAYEYHLTPYESVARAILDPDVPDLFIEVPIEPNLRGVVVHSYLHTSQIAKLYLHDELTPDTAPTPEAKGG